MTLFMSYWITHFILENFHLFACFREKVSTLIYFRNGKEKKNFTFYEYTGCSIWKHKVWFITRKGNKNYLRCCFAISICWNITEKRGGINEIVAHYTVSWSWGNNNYELVIQPKLKFSLSILMKIKCWSLQKNYSRKNDHIIQRWRIKDFDQKNEIEIYCREKCNMIGKIQWIVSHTFFSISLCSSLLEHL